MRRATSTLPRLTLSKADFYPRSPCGERRPVGHTQPRCAHFYPRSPCGERLRRVLELRQALGISIHALLAESDPLTIYGFPQATHISIQALLTESDGAYRGARQSRRHFYPRSPCGERLAITYLTLLPFDISIHALLAESDRLARFLDLLFALLFLSTLSLRRATWSSLSSQFLYFHFYPRSPCGERLSYFRVWA